MFRTLVVAACLLPTLATAQQYGTEPLRQSYASIMLTNLGGTPQEMTIEVLPLEGGGFLEINCFPEAPTSCWTVQYVEFANALAWGAVDPSAPVEDMLAALVPVETPTRSGGSVFPLRDGAVFEWEEVWRSDEFNADYDMTLTVQCCQTPVSAGVSEQDEHWVLTFNYVNGDEIGVPHEGTLTFYYDDVLGVMVNQQTQTLWADEAPLNGMATLTDYARPE